MYGDFKTVWIGSLTGGFIDTTGKNEKTFTGEGIKGISPIDAIFVYSVK